MKEKSLAKNGLSMSDAQNISNLINQKVKTLMVRLQQLNNCSKTFTHGTVEYLSQEGHSIKYLDVVGILNKVAQYTSCQAILMENIKLKDNLLKEIRFGAFSHNLVEPERPNIKSPVVGNTNSIEGYLDMVFTDKWAEEQLLTHEWEEYIYNEAIASTIGKFIHKDGKLDKLREELVNMPTIEFFSLEEGKRMPVKVSKHHDENDLFTLHEKLSNIHKDATKRVNYYKAKMHNAITTAKIEEGTKLRQQLAAYDEQYAIAMRDYNARIEEFEAKVKVRRNEFEIVRNEELKRVSQLRIAINPIYQSVIDEFTAL